MRYTTLILISPYRKMPFNLQDVRAQLTTLQAAPAPRYAYFKGKKNTATYCDSGTPNFFGIHLINLNPPSRCFSQETGAPTASARRQWYSKS